VAQYRGRASHETGAGSLRVTSLCRRCVTVRAMTMLVCLLHHCQAEPHLRGQLSGKIGILLHLLLPSSSIWAACHELFHHSRFAFLPQRLVLLPPLQLPTCIWRLCCVIRDDDRRHENICQSTLVRSLCLLTVDHPYEEHRQHRSSAVVTLLVGAVCSELFVRCGYQDVSQDRAWFPCACGLLMHAKQDETGAGPRTWSPRAASAASPG